jgi:uncharacterized protein (DUF849 family)
MSGACSYRNGAGGAVLIKACLNGGTTREEHPAVPQTPDELAVDEDTTILPDSRPASGNGELVEAAISLVVEMSRPS